MSPKLSSLIAVIALALSTLQKPSHADDWPQWGGPSHDDAWRESGILRDFPKDGPKILWRTPIHRGYAGPAVAAGRVFVFDRQIADGATVPKSAFERGQIPGDERLLCLDANSGKTLWEKSEPVNYTVSYAAGPRTTPTVDGDRVYTLGAEGHLHCRSVQDGKLLWFKDLKQLPEAHTPVWGYASSPLLDGDLLICLAAGDGCVAVAFDKRTGQERWRALSAKEPGYCPPKIIHHHGKRSLLIWHPESINALDPATGKLQWTVPWKLRSGLSVPDPQLSGDYLLLTSFYNGSMLLKLDGTNPPSVVWRTENESEKRTEHLNGIINSAVISKGHFYGACSYGEFRCLELLSGKRIWESLKPVGLEKPSRWGTVFVTPHEDRFFLFSETGELAIAHLTPSGYAETCRAKVIEPNGIDMRQRPIVWSHPAYAMKSCFVRNDSEIIRIDLSAP
jgi:outer membrane protein assembly factor BamB